MAAGAATDPARAAAIRALYAHMHNTTAAVAVIVAYVVTTAWPFTAWPAIAGWTGAIALFQVARELLARRFAAAAPPDAALERWATAYVVHQGLAAGVWGASMFLFAHPDQPITVALTLCALFSVAAGAVPAQAYTPASFIALVSVLFALVLARLLSFATLPYALLGVASALFGVAMVGYCRIQAGVVGDGFRMRFENDALLAALQVEKADAEDARRRAERASLAKSQFLAAASHDLRQPLYALSLFSGSLGELRLDADGRAVVENIQESIAVMEALFNGLLDISRLEAGVVQPNPTPLSVDLLFDRLSQYFRPLALDRGLEFRLRSDGEWIMSDATLLEQVLGNLLSNALRCTPAGGVLLAARIRGERVRLEVWDTGIGIADVDRERIFDEFVQVGNPERDRSKGLGLGLSIAQRSAVLLGSTIEVASWPGRGSRFAIALPAQAAVQRHPIDLATATAQRLPRIAGLPVLIVEDDSDVRLALADLLRRWSLPVAAVASADEALQLMRDGARFGAVLSDYRLAGDLDGFAFLDRLRDEHPSPTPAAAIITGDMDAELIAAAASRSVPLLHKPLRPADLRELLGVA